MKSIAMFKHSMANWESSTFEGMFVTTEKMKMDAGMIE